MQVVELTRTRRVLPVLAWSVCAVSVASVVGVLVITSLGGSSLAAFGTFGTVVVSTFSLVGGLIATRRPKNPIGWLFCAVGLSFAVAGIASAWADYALVKEPGGLPFGGFMAWIGVWAWPPGILLLFTFLLLLFPDGHLPSRRWRPVAWLSGIALVAMVVPTAVTAWPIRGPILTNIGDTAPAAAPDSFKLAYNVQVAGVLLMFVLGIVSAASLLLRLRRSTGDEREQIKWFGFAAAIVVVVVILASPLFNIPGEFQVLAFPLLPVASAVAILKYRLYDIDVVINKTVVFTALAAFVTAIYLAVVVGVGAAVGTTGEPNVVLSIVATAIVALAFQPLRERARRLANHIVYGKRATPYEVLAEFSDRVATTYAAEDVLPRMAQILATGTGADSARVWLRFDEELRAAASWPEDGAVATIAVIDDDRPGRFEAGEHGMEVRHQGELLGALSVTMPPSDPMNPSKARLVRDLAAQAGLVLRNVRLIEELRASRRRIVTAQDERAKQLERNLHDGAQQQLVALGVQLGLAHRVAARDAPQMAELLDGLRAQATDALENLRDLARGIYPPLLADRGLVVALDAQARKAALPVDVDGHGIGRYPQEVESAVYFCCLEALQNVAKYANASTARVRLTDEDGAIKFAVSDDGGGFDPGRVPLGTGLQGIKDRLDALRGKLTVESSPGAGTTVAGSIPVHARVPT